MPRVTHWIFRALARIVFLWTMRVEVIRSERAHRSGRYVIVCNHISHLDPVCLSVILRRRIDWMARIEFFRNPFSSWLMKSVDAFPVNRQGLALRGIRTAIERLKQDRVVGICPEGEVTRGMNSALRGGAVKKGALLIACRADAPILPCVILGTEQLDKVKTWLPFRRGKLLLICGSFIEPNASAKGTRKQVREAMRCELQQAFVSLYAEARRTHGIKDEQVP
ncbi:MAG: 1-acyl-sn-glycerol-3-phosphate acyltransferase [Verrucomicrobia bacterium]|nr:1-acyl-sn-glycerol-3-phosphate acyltransferase [Verrucomicrobiota bacterium]